MAKQQVSYHELLIQIKRAKLHLDTLKRGTLSYRDYKKFYDKLCKQRAEYQKYLANMDLYGDKD